jgi:C4-dicarboxylate transporter, DctM subunit
MCITNSVLLIRGSCLLGHLLGGAAIVIMAPDLTPVAISFGIDPVYFGIIMIINFEVGMLPPPIGVNLFVAYNMIHLME